jgi:hypothetical protein
MSPSYLDRAIEAWGEKQKALGRGERDREINKRDRTIKTQEARIQSLEQSLLNEEDVEKVFLLSLGRTVAKRFKVGSTFRIRGTAFSRKSHAMWANAYDKQTIKITEVVDHATVKVVRWDKRRKNWMKTNYELSLINLVNAEAIN